MEDRRDPMLTYAMTALAANKQARLAGQRATFGRVEVEPNGTNAVPVAGAPPGSTPGLDSTTALAELVDDDRRGRPPSAPSGTARRVEVTAESVSGAVAFDPALAARIAADHAGGDWPVIPTAAGHDAGILSAAGIPTAMLFVRNPTGVSHSPAEHAEIADCLAGVARARRHPRAAGAVTGRDGVPRSSGPGSTAPSTTTCSSRSRTGGSRTVDRRDSRSPSRFARERGSPAGR